MERRKVEARGKKEELSKPSDLSSGFEELGAILDDFEDKMRNASRELVMLNIAEVNYPRFKSKYKKEKAISERRFRGV